MNKILQNAFNKGFKKAIKDGRRLVKNKNDSGYTVMVPIASVMRSFRPFIEKVNKELYKTK